jgi:hypothetical protein
MKVKAFEYPLELKEPETRFETEEVPVPMNVKALEYPVEDKPPLVRLLI